VGPTPSRKKIVASEEAEVYGLRQKGEGGGEVKSKGGAGGDVNGGGNLESRTKCLRRRNRVLVLREGRQKRFVETDKGGKWWGGTELYQRGRRWGLSAG